MATRPNVKIIQENGALGRTNPSEDGITLLVVTAIAVGGKFALGDTLGPFRSPADAEALGIDAAYDTANDLLAYQHISDFYLGAGNGTELYVLPVAETVTMEDICDVAEDYSAPVLASLKGKIRLLCVTRIPDAVGTLVDQFPTDLGLAITKAQALRDSEFAEPKHRPLQIFLEGHNFQGNASSSINLRELEANRISVIISQDSEVAAKDAAFAKYANAAYFCGIEAGLPVQRNAGRVKNGKLPIAIPALSSGTLMSAVSDADLETLNAHGFIFMLQHSGKDGYFFNDDHTCCPLSDDYAFVSHGRAMDKASRITRQVYLEELLDDIDVDADTGRLAVATIKNYQGVVETAINSQMTVKGEISGVSCFVDPDQDINATDEIETEVSIRKKGTSRYIKSTLKFSTAQ